MNDLLGITLFNCDSGRLWELRIKLGNLLGSCNPILDNEVDHAKEVLAHFWGIVKVDLTRVDRVVPNYTTEVEGLLDLHGKPFGNERPDIRIDILAFLS